MSQIIFTTKQFKNQAALRTIENFKAENAGMLPLMEIFKTYEGEGSKIGTPRILVRFGGCPVYCNNCDTPQSFNVRKSMRVISPEDLSTEIVKLATDDAGNYTVREISLTGGEPMMYPNEVKNLALEFHALGLKTSIETSGTILDQEVFSYFDYVSLDIKPPSTGVNFTFQQLQAIYDFKSQHTGAQVKVVISDEYDLTWVTQNLGQFINPLSKATPLILTPNSPFIKDGQQEDATYYDLMMMIVNWNKGYNIVVIPQIHKLLQFA
jgi:7-carboxy-7-deazaguanine synthase